MRIFPFIFILTVGFGTATYAQEESYNKKSAIRSMTDSNVINAKRWHNQGNIESSLRTGLEVLASKKPLSSIDSFYTYQVLAFNFRALNAPETALDYAKKSIAIMQHLDPEYNSKISWIAPYFSSVEAYDAALFYLKKELAYNFSTIDTLRLLKTYNNIGFNFFLNEKNDSAVKYYTKIIDFNTTNEKHNDIIGIASGNLGVVYLANNEYEKALIHLKIDAALTKNKIPESYYNALLKIAEIYLIQKKYNQAHKILKVFFTSGKKDLKKINRGNKLMAKVLKMLSKHKESANYLNKYILISDSLIDLENPHKKLIHQLSRKRIKLIEKDLALAKKEVELMNTHLILSQNIAQSESLKNTIYLILLAISFLFVTELFLYHKNKQKKNLEIHQLETELITVELKSKKADLNNVVTNLSYKRNFIDEVQSKLKSLQNQPEGEIKKNISALIRAFNSYKSADKNMAVLQSDIDTVNHSFFKKLGNKFPLLTDNEKELCGLLLLNLSSKDIAKIKNISPNAVKKARQRIRKKLPISQSEKIIDFLENV
jgi:hypothetical protein